MARPEIVPRDAGFTLVEVLTAIFVTAILAAMGSAILITSLQGQDRMQAASETLRRLEITRAVIKADLSQVVARAARTPEGGQSPAFVGGVRGDEAVFLAFSRLGWENPDARRDRGGVAFVEYVWRDGAVIRRLPARADPDDETPVSERVLLEGVADVAVAFARGGVWTPEWVAGPQGTMPDGVRLEFDVDGVGRVRQVVVTPSGG